MIVYSPIGIQMLMSPSYLTETPGQIYARLQNQNVNPLITLIYSLRIHYLILVLIATEI